MAMEYLQAELTLVRAEQLALAQNDFDALAHLYMPLQEARRQRRQRCGEGTIRLDLIAKSPDDKLDPGKIAPQFPQGQFLVAGWGTIQPAIELRRLQRDRAQYAETLLAAVFPKKPFDVVVIVPTETDQISHDQFPPHSLILKKNELPRPDYSEVMNLWERLHAPFLAAADAEPDPLKKIQAYRKTIEVDYACELAHQNLAEVAKQLASAP